MDNINDIVLNKYGLRTKNDRKVEAWFGTVFKK